MKNLGTNTLQRDHYEEHERPLFHMFPCMKLKQSQKKISKCLEPAVFPGLDEIFLAIDVR